MGHQHDELVVAHIGGTGDDVVQQGHVGLIVQGDGAGHAHVHVGMTAVHGAGEHGGAGLLRHLLGQADGVEAVQAVGAVRAVLLNGAQGQDRHIVDLVGIRDVYGCGVLVKKHRVSLIQLELRLLLHLSHVSQVLSLFPKCMSFFMISSRLLTNKINRLCAKTGELFQCLDEHVDFFFGVMLIKTNSQCAANDRW